MATLREEISEEIIKAIEREQRIQALREIETERDAAEKVHFLFLGGFVFSLAHLLINALLGGSLFLHWGFVFVALAGMIMNQIQRL